MTKEKQIHLREVAGVFFKLGLVAFGGPAAHIAMMEDELVEKRKWLPREEFLDLMGATNLIPGPNSTEMTMHCGHARAGTAGLWVAGACFIFPAVVVTGILAWLYVTYGQLPEVEPFIYGIKPAVLAVIAAAVWKLGKKAMKNWELGILAAIVIAASLVFHVNEIWALLGAGFLGMLYFTAKASTTAKTVIPFLPLLISSGSVAKLSTLNVFLSFLKVGAILYGSGYVLFAYLDAELVANGWLSRQELIDAIAVGQFTPGPVLSTATFIGYQLDGPLGAIAATGGIFLPSFVFVLITHPFIPRMRKSKVLRFFLDSVNAAALAVMAAVLFKMGKEVLIGWEGIVIALIAAFFTFGPKKLSPIWIILGGSVLGWLFTFAP